MASKNPLSGPSRTFLDDAEQARLRSIGGLVTDSRRSRPRYFDGRFLAARDLTADQQYVLTRQADLGRAAGAGIASGLEVTAGSTAGRLGISAGLGVTPSGETVVLSADLEVDLFQLRESLLLDGHLGLRETERTALSRVRTGAFVLALRPIEYTANPRRGYPTEINGERRVEDHDIVEATAVTLVPWPKAYGGGARGARRALAREVFVNQTAQGVAADLVPLAMVYLDGVSIQWLDVELVRRELGADRGDVLGLSETSRAARAGYVRQYQQHLVSVLSGLGGRPLAAVDHFDALPPIGQLPASVIQLNGLTQGFFPAEVDVDISFIPTDELPTLVEDSLLLPPVDLTSGSDVLSSVSVLILVPVSRDLFASARATLSDVRRPLIRRTRLATTVRSPLLALSRLRLPSVIDTLVYTTPTDVETAAWSSFLTTVLDGLGANPLLWYVRRRNIHFAPALAGQPVDIDGNEF